MTKAVRAWVDPGFKKRLKKEAIDLDISVLELTRNLSRDTEEGLSGILKKKNEKRGFNFSL